MPKVSVIVPIYNVEQYLYECIESVLAQTFSDFELILVDDGSPDGCGAICDSYVEKDCRIRVIHKENGGLSDARNAALNIACGNYLYFLDSDDMIAPDLLQKVVRCMEEGADMAVFGFQCFYPDHHVSPGRVPERKQFRLEGKSERRQFIQQVLLPCQIGWEACTRVYRRDLVERYQLRFEDNRRIFAEDLYFTLCYCGHIEKIVCLDECLYHYRQRDDSIMGIQKKRNNIGRINELGKAVLEYYSWIV